MKIFYLSESPFPSPAANTVQVMQMCSAMAHAGHSVTLVCRQPDDAELNRLDPFSYYALPPTFHIVRRRFLPVRGRKSLWAVGAALRARLSGAELVYGRSVRGCYYASRFGLPVVYEAHKPLNAADPGEMERGRQLFGSNELLRVVVLSQKLAAKFIDQYNIDPQRIRVVYNGADDPGGPTPMPLTPASNGSLRIGYAGSLYPGKGVELIAAIAADCPWAHFFVAGGSSTEVHSCRQSILADNVTFLGNLAHTQLPAFRAAMDVLLVPPKAQVRVSGGGTIDQADAPPLKLFEALAAGKAIVCSDYLAEVVKDGLHAVLRDPEHSDQWVSALRRLSENPAERVSLGRQAHELYQRDYSWKSRAEKVLAP